MGRPRCSKRRRHLQHRHHHHYCWNGSIEHGLLVRRLHLQYRHADHYRQHDPKQPNRQPWSLWREWRRNYQWWNNDDSGQHHQRKHSARGDLQGGDGGGISGNNNTITNSTIAGNSALHCGGVAGGGNIAHTTFSTNSASRDGGAIYLTSPLELGNTILKSRRFGCQHL